MNTIYLRYSFAFIFSAALELWLDPRTRKAQFLEVQFQFYALTL